MASYATLADLAKHAPPGSIQDLTDGVKQAALDAFSDEMDTYFRSQEVLPLTEPYPLVVVRHCCAGAVWQLMTYKGFNPENGSNIVFEKNYDRAIEWLVSVARGQVSLAVGSDSAPAPRPGGARVATQPRRGWG